MILATLHRDGRRPVASFSGLVHVMYSFACASLRAEESEHKATIAYISPHQFQHLASRTPAILTFSWRGVKVLSTNLLATASPTINICAQAEECASASRYRPGRDLMGPPPDLSKRSSHDRPTFPEANKHGTTNTSMSSDSNGDPLRRTDEQNVENGASGNTIQEQRPPLPPRPSLLQTGNGPASPHSPSKSALQAKATTAISPLDIQTLSFPDGSRGTFSAPTSGAVSESLSELPEGQGTPSRTVNRNGSDWTDDASLMSIAPTSRGNGDLASFLDDELNTQSPAWRLLNSQTEAANLFETAEFEDTSLIDFDHEFDEIEAVDSQKGNEG